MELDANRPANGALGAVDVGIEVAPVARKPLALVNEPGILRRDGGLETPDLGVEHKLVVKSGAWYSYGDQRIGQGRDNAKLFLRDNPALQTEVEGKVKEFKEKYEVLKKDFEQIKKVIEEAKAAKDAGELAYKKGKECFDLVKAGLKKIENGSRANIACNWRD